MINQAIIREYDIRGVVDESLFERDAFLVGWSFAQKAQNEIVNVCCDGRLSSPKLLTALISGLVEGGAKVRFIGVGPTPMLYFSAFHFNAAGGIMITGSHNPPTHNGFKFIYRNKPFFGADIRELGEISKNYSGDYPVHQDYILEDCKQAYVERLLQDCKMSKELRIAWDPGNGAAGEIVSLLTQIMPGQHFVINEKIDGTFPAHHPDPTVAENLVELMGLVSKNSCQVGLAFDGDGDRIGVVDSKKRIVWGDQLLLIYAKEILATQPKAVIIADVKASQKLFEGVAELGGTPLMWKTGHSLIKTKMQEQNSPLAGEMSGHIFFADKYYGFDDGLYAAIRLLKIIANSDVTLDQIVDGLPVVYNTPEIRIECDEARKFALIEELKRDLDKKKLAYDTTDGIRFNHPYGWWLLRASNTQAILVARCEADSVENLSRLKAELAQLLLHYNIDAQELHE